MKNYIKILLIFSFLSISSITLPMEEQPEIQPMDLQDIGLPNEIWAEILEHVYFDFNSFLNLKILDEANNIYEAIDLIEKYIAKCLKTISLVCKTFRALAPKISRERLLNFKQQIRKLYIPFLNERFLEQREDKEGFYPKNGDWDMYKPTNNDIAKFIKTGIIKNDLLHNQIADTICPARLAQINFKLFKLLLFYGANPNINSDLIDRGTPLYWTIRHHNYIEYNCRDVIIDLLEYGADPDIPNKDIYQETSLHLAVRFHYPLNRNNIDVIIALLQNGADPNMVDKYGRTALNNAISKHHPKKSNCTDLIFLLLKYNADPNIQTDGQTILHIAVEDHHPLHRNNTEIIIALLQNDADPNIRNKYDKTVFDIAEEQNFTEFPQLVKTHAKDT